MLAVEERDDEKMQPRGAEGVASIGHLIHEEISTNVRILMLLLLTLVVDLKIGTYGMVKGIRFGTSAL
jgi:hypothetical protein